MQYFIRHIPYAIERHMVVIVLLMFTIGCNSENALFLEIKAPVTIQCDGAEKALIDPSSSQHKLIAGWFKNNQKGWSTSPASYVPGIVIQGPDFTINVLDRIIVVNDGKAQYVKKIEGKNYFYRLCKEMK